MNCGKINREAGNAFLYVLIAIVLFGALMFTLSRSEEQNDGNSDLTEGRTSVSANEIMAYAATVTNAITQMQNTGTQNSQIDFMLPDDSTFNDPPTLYKLFHPDGGGLNYKALPSNAVGVAGTLTPKAGYYVGRFNNVEWTPTTQNDVMFVAYNISQPVCAEIDRKLRGSTTIPAFPSGNAKQYFINGTIFSGSNQNLMATDCAACDEIPAMCVSFVNGATTHYLFYNIIESE